MWDVSTVTSQEEDPFLCGVCSPCVCLGTLVSSVLNSSTQILNFCSALT